MPHPDSHACARTRTLCGVHQFPPHIKIGFKDLFLRAKPCTLCVLHKLKKKEPAPSDSITCPLSPSSPQTSLQASSCPIQFLVVEAQQSVLRVFCNAVKHVPALLGGREEGGGHGIGTWQVRIYQLWAESQSWPKGDPVRTSPRPSPAPAWSLGRPPPPPPPPEMPN